MIETITYNTPETMFNVSEEYRGLTPDLIKEKLESHRTQVVNICMNNTNDFNKGSIIRASHSFLSKEVILVGKKKFDRRSTTGLHHIENIKHSTDIFEVISFLIDNGYTVFPVTRNLLATRKVYELEFPEKTAFIYEEEYQELTDEIIKSCNGAPITTRSGSEFLNSGMVSAVLLNEYNRQSFVR